MGGLGTPGIKSRKGLMTKKMGDEINRMIRDVSDKSGVIERESIKMRREKAERGGTCGMGGMDARSEEDKREEEEEGESFYIANNVEDIGNEKDIEVSGERDMRESMRESAREGMRKGGRGEDGSVNGGERREKSERRGKIRGGNSGQRGAQDDRGEGGRGNIDREIDREKEGEWEEDDGSGTWRDTRVKDKDGILSSASSDSEGPPHIIYNTLDETYNYNSNDHPNTNTYNNSDNNDYNSSEHNDGSDIYGDLRGSFDSTSNEGSDSNCGFRPRRGDWKEEFKSVWKMQCVFK